MAFIPKNNRWSHFDSQKGVPKKEKEKKILPWFKVLMNVTKKVPQKSNLLLQHISFKK